jgi:hypothetical protein
MSLDDGTSVFGFEEPVSNFNTVSDFGVWGDLKNGVGVIGSVDMGIGVQAVCPHGTALLATGKTQLDGDVRVHGELVTVGDLNVNGGAGIFGVLLVDGNVHVHKDLDVKGTLRKGKDEFRIDHPLDPANKYLSHCVVEPADMKNIYDGVVVLDAAGEAVVELPEWFEALNDNFRYQLTAIGAPGPRLHVAGKIAGNCFKIAGGEDGMEVSWQVTGIRRDAYANAHRTVVEEEKGEAERGGYLHPELFSQPASAGVSGEKRVCFNNPFSPATSQDPAA